VRYIEKIGLRPYTSGRMSLSTYRTLMLIIGDALILWMGLFFALFFRYGLSKFYGELPIHILPFSIVFAIWIVIFYIAGLYEVRTAGNYQRMLKVIVSSMLAGGILAMALFYFVPAFTITPKTNLILTVAITTMLLIAWHSFYASASKRTSKLKIALLGSSPDIEELARIIESFPQHGYIIECRFKDTDVDILPLIRDKKVDIVVAPKEAQSNSSLMHALYEALPRHIRLVDASVFYEQILGKVPVSLISKIWFLENLTETEKSFFEASKRVLDIFFAISLGSFGLFMFVPIVLLIKLSSRGPLFIKQKRVGRFGKEFTIYKYRTMVSMGPDGLAEPNGAEWSQPNDARITKAGRMLRSTRLDELPQVWNIVRGELSFIGPRPERPQFVEKLRREIPFYDMRHIVRPGLSGWAQINPPYYYASKEETYLKLQYDLFYIKNRDLGLDLAIALKTLMVILSQQGR
jgi:exopolysaccharide biosynthesis polyprenyl glycosylphosphotransferase